MALEHARGKRSKAFARNRIDGGVGLRIDGGAGGDCDTSLRLFHR